MAITDRQMPPRIIQWIETSQFDWEPRQQQDQRAEQHEQVEGAERMLPISKPVTTRSRHDACQQSAQAQSDD